MSDINGRDFLSREKILQPFLEKARCIQPSLDILHREKLFQDFSGEIAGIIETYERLRLTTFPYIQEKTGHQFQNPDLFSIVFLYSEISQFFNKVNQRVANGNRKIPISPEIISGMTGLREDHLTLAFIGDSAIELGVLATIWPQETACDVPQNATLDIAKKIFVEGENQAKIWDYLVPGDSDSLQKSNEIKSSQFEAVFGIIYLEGGLEDVEKAIRMLEQSMHQ
jgi:dsRNA-specific ribonuclease